MKLNRLLCAAGALSLAATGCAYQGSSYGHGAWSSPTYSAHRQAPRHSYQGRHHGVHQMGQTRVEVEIGAEQFVDGDIFEAGDAVFFGGPMTTAGVGYSDAYKRGYRASAGLARNVRPNTTLTAKGFYSEAEGETGINVGTNGGGNVTGTFSDYKTYGAEVGLRQYLNQRPTRLRPYVGATVGAAYIDDINLTSTAGTGIINEASWVPTASGMAGFELPVSPRASFAVESGVRWTGSQDRSAAASNAGFVDDGSKLSVPVTLRGSFRF